MFILLFRSVQCNIMGHVTRSLFSFFYFFYLFIHFFKRVALLTKLASLPSDPL